MTTGRRDLVFDSEGDVQFTFEKEENQPTTSSHNGEATSNGWDLNQNLYTFDTLLTQSCRKRELSNSSHSEAHVTTMLVSSRHLTLSSSVFKAMLRTPFREGETLSLHGKVTINLPEDDPAAFEILMNIIHAKNRAIPKTVPLIILTELAILVDKYRMHEAIGFLADLWIDNLKHAIPGLMLMCEDLMPWMAITSVFRRRVEYDQVTRIARCYTVGTRFQLKQGGRFTESLPIPERLIGKQHSSFWFSVYELNITTEEIDKLRQRDISSALSELEALVVKFQSPRPNICPRSEDMCADLLLGSLLRSALSLKLWPLPQKPYENLSYMGVSSAIRALKIQSFCERPTPGYSGYSNSADKDHNIMQGVRRKLELIEIDQHEEFDFFGHA